MTVGPSEGVRLPRVSTPHVNRSGTWVCDESKLHPVTPDHVVREIVAKHLRLASEMLAMLHARASAR